LQGHTRLVENQRFAGHVEDDWPRSVPSIASHLRCTSGYFAQSLGTLSVTFNQWLV
jgi:hypothetical protein